MLNPDIDHAVLGFVLLIIALSLCNEQLVLAMGNFMNKGNSRVGEASGFRIGFLSQVNVWFYQFYLYLSCSKLVFSCLKFKGVNFWTRDVERNPENQI